MDRAGAGKAMAALDGKLLPGQARPFVVQKYVRQLFSNSQKLGWLVEFIAKFLQFQLKSSAEFVFIADVSTAVLP